MTTWKTNLLWHRHLQVISPWILSDTKWHDPELHHQHRQDTYVAGTQVNVQNARSQDEPIKKHCDALLERRFCWVDTKFGQTGHRCSSNSRIFQHNTIVDEADIFCWLWRFWTFNSQQMEYADGQFCEFAIFNKFAKMREGLLLRFRDKFDHIKHSLNNSALEVITTFIPQHAGEECKHWGMFWWEFEAERANSLHDDDFEFVTNFGHKSSDLFDQTINRCFIASLKNRLISKRYWINAHTFRRVVIAYVATLRLGSVIRVSRSILQVATLVGWIKASAASVLVAANFRTGFGVVKKICKTTPNTL